MTKRILKALTAFVLAIGVFVSTFAPVLPVSDYALTVEAKAKKPKLNKAKITLSTGETFTLTIKNASGKIKFSSSNKKVASVDKKGVITAKKNGSTKITAKVGKKKLTCKVSVKKMSIDKKSLSVAAGSTATVTLKNAKNVEWSSNSGIVTVSGNDSSATIKGVKEGKATVSAKAGSVTVKCNVTVTKGSGDNSGDSGSSQATSDVKQPTIQYSLSDIMMDDGSGSGTPVPGKMVQAKITFNGFPKNVDDLKKISRTSGNGNSTNRQYDGKFLTVACTLAALAAYSEGRNSDGKAMLDYLMVSPHISAANVGSASNCSYYFEYNDKKKKLPWAYFDGATHNNDYTPTQPLATTMEEYPYVLSPSTYYGVQLNIEGVRFNSTAHPALKQATDKILVYEDPTDHQWYLWPSGFSQLLTDASIKVPGQ